MSTKEIGSEFSYQPAGEGNGIRFPEMMDYSFAFSGRTAIETVIRNENIRKVLMPSYCCDSMIEPFRKHGIDIAFYSVNYVDELCVDVNIQDDVDCFFWCNYFGYKNSFPQLGDYVARGGIVIEDITHSLLSEYQYHIESDYIVASIRKWVPVLCGGYVGSKKKNLRIKPTRIPTEDFISVKEKAMKDKGAYLNGDADIDKAKFLSAYGRVNNWLGENYSDMTIDSFSNKIVKTVEENKIKQQRIKNAQILYDGLKEQEEVSLLFPYEALDCPLFVPVIIANNKRDLVQKKLTENNVYCPVHWPRPDANCESNLYDLEISLICDQRYDENDMRRIVEVLTHVEMGE